MPEHKPDIFEQLLQLLQALIMPVWNDLIVLIPWVLIAIVIVWLVFMWRQWRGAASVNRPRLIPLSPGPPPPGVHLPGPSWWPFVAPIAIALVLFGLIKWPLLIAVGLVVGLIPLAGWLRDANREWRRTAMVGEGAGGHAVLAAASVPLALPSGTWRMPPSVPQVAPMPQVERMEPPPGVHMPGPSPWPFFAPIAIAVVFFGLIFSPFLLVGGIVMGVIAAAGWLRDANREWRSTEQLGHAVPATLEPERAWPRWMVPLYGYVLGISLLLTVLPSVGTWLGSLKPAAASPTPVAVPAQPEISASDAKSFDTKTLVVPAGRPFDLVFHNKQPDTPHNVKIADGPAQATVLFDGEVVTGPTDITYHVPALQAGDYYFLCKVHPNMNGTVQARPETGPAPGGPDGSLAPGSSGAAPSP